MTLPLLYMTYRSPYARKVRVALIEKGIPFDEVSVDLAHKPQELLVANPWGTVPTLVMPEGLVLADSTLILHFLEDAFPRPSLLPAGLNERYAAWNWEELSDRLCDAGVAVFHAAADESRLAVLRTKMTDFAAETCQRAKQALSRAEYLVGDYSVADVALATTLEWMAFRLSFDLSLLPTQVQAWLRRLDARDSFLKTLPRLG